MLKPNLFLIKMTCEYFSIKGGKLFCRVYGAIDSSPEKIEECHFNYGSCLKAARKSEEQSTLKNSEASAERKERVILERAINQNPISSGHDFF